MNIDVIINFIHREDMILTKILGRRICPDCNKNFNVAHIETDDGYYMPPLMPNCSGPNGCDNPNCEAPANFITRDDDTEEVVKNRLAIYDKETLPILDFYNQ